ncbi:phosphonate C-P lyase system protein PhnH [Sporosarcina sp. G11-34]|uniref:phosphonate C-P lyase system protein PhnH n=1 Tax=Sporosarcina sp. G11-34 TaxID=2849605 RepID=UPI0022A9C55B|nr:phosphonate C-P lyase system protein PhnH [Sporosarcina sp. G11-34]MCZ2259165.1 phosphonate C-P lyase system protein PhnH [Sporosarcina sp. G11-34]
MAIDVVHDTQEVFRTILHCMSRPGTIKNIEEVGKPVKPFGYCQHSTSVTAITLLDAEVSFHVIGENATAIENYLSAFTLSKVADVHIADYIFIMKDAKKQTISDIFNKAKKGTLLNPHESATIIVETDALSNGKDLLLKGPGIQHTENVKIDGSEFWVMERAEVNKEYPLGVDMVLIDRESNMICLPRTTMIHDCEVS